MWWGCIWFRQGTEAETDNRLSRSKEIFLMDAETMEGITDMVILMGKVAPGMLGNPTPLLAGDKSSS